MNKIQRQSETLSKAAEIIRSLMYQITLDFNGEECSLPAEVNEAPHGIKNSMDALTKDIDNLLDLTIELSKIYISSIEHESISKLQTKIDGVTIEQVLAIEENKDDTN